MPNPYLVQTLQRYFHNSNRCDSLASVVPKLQPPPRLGLALLLLWLCAYWPMSSSIPVIEPIGPCVRVDEVGGLRQCKWQPPPCLGLALLLLCACWPMSSPILFGTSD